MEAWLVAAVALIALARCRGRRGPRPADDRARSRARPSVIARRRPRRRRPRRCANARSRPTRPGWSSDGTSTPWSKASRSGCCRVDDGLRITAANAAAHALLDREPPALVRRTAHRGVPRHRRRDPRASGARLRVVDRRGRPRRPRRIAPGAPRAAQSIGRGLAGPRGRLRAAPAPADPDRVHRQPLARAADAADDGQPPGRDARPARPRPRATRCRPGCATGSARSSSRPAISSRWSTSCSTCRGSRAAARSARSTSSISAAWRASRPSAFGSSPIARASSSGSRSPTRSRRSAATPTGSAR